MPCVRKVDKPQNPKFLAVDQFKLEWGHFTKSASQPKVGGTAVHAVVAMTCELTRLTPFG